MKKRKLYVEKVFFSALLLLSASCFLAADMRKIESVQDTSFFQGDSGFASGTLKSYATMPSEEKALSTENYGRIVKVFNWWLKKALKPQYVPSLDFIEKNIRLIPAAKNESQKDLAFLSYKIKEKTFMIVQTGGLKAYTLIFLHDPASGKINDIPQASNRTQSFLKDYINETIWKYIPEFAIKKVKEGIIAEVMPGKGQKMINYAKFFINGDETCLFIQKVYFEDTVPAREPMSNQWFEFWKGK